MYRVVGRRHTQFLFSASVDKVLHKYLMGPELAKIFRYVDNTFYCSKVAMRQVLTCEVPEESCIGYRNLKPTFVPRHVRGSHKPRIEKLLLPYAMCIQSGVLYTTVFRQTLRYAHGQMPKRPTQGAPEQLVNGSVVPSSCCCGSGRTALFDRFSVIAGVLNSWGQQKFTYLVVIV